jgi:hypothetical protein
MCIETSRGSDNITVYVKQRAPVGKIKMNYCKVHGMDNCKVVQYVEKLEIFCGSLKYHISAINVKRFTGCVEKPIYGLL